MNRLNTQKRMQIVSCLVEGNSLRATTRMTGAAKNTVTKLLIDLGKACAEYQNQALRNKERIKKGVKSALDSSCLKCGGRHNVADQARL